MNDDNVWRKRFQLFLAIRLFGLLTFLLGMAIAFSDLLRPGGWKLVGGILVVIGVVDAMVAPRILKKSWERPGPVKRFWKAASKSLKPDDGFGIALDGRPVKTPARAELIVPDQRAGRGHRGGMERLRRRRRPARHAADRPRQCGDRPHRTGQGDVCRRASPATARATSLCYRAEGPDTLVRRQSESWDALLAWARRRYDVDFACQSGVMHVAQPEDTVRKLGHAVAALDPFQLAGLSPLVTIGGSLVAGLAVLEEMMPAEAAWEAVSLDDRWQLEQWGDDPEARGGARCAASATSWPRRASSNYAQLSAGDQFPDEAHQIRPGASASTAPRR